MLSHPLQERNERVSYSIAGVACCQRRAAYAITIQLPTGHHERYLTAFASLHDPVSHPQVGRTCSSSAGKALAEPHRLHSEGTSAIHCVSANCLDAILSRAPLGM